MSKLDVMVDLETLGTRPGCAILTIGACTFDAKHQFYQRISPDNARTFLKEEIETVRWWGKQDPRARLEAFGGTSTALDVLNSFSDWMASLEDKKNIRLWGNGADFDLPILKAAYDTFDLQIPWSPFGGRCYRTLKDLLPHIAAEEKNAMKHNALQDAVYQARHAVLLMQAL